MFIGASSLVQGRQRSPEEAQTIKVTLHPPDAFSTAGWRLDSAQLEAALGLWVWTMLSDERVTKSSNDQKSRSKAERISTARIVSAGIADGNWDAKVNIQSEMDLWLGRSAMKFREGLLHCHVNTSCGLATLFELSKHASMRRGPDSKSEETISLQNDRGDSINQAKIPDFRPLDFSEEDKLSLQRFSGWCHIDGKNNTGSGPPTSLAKNSTLGSEGTTKFRIQYSDLTISKTSLLDLCAQELFTSLMMSLAGFLPLSKTVPREDTGQIRLENESVNAFVNAFQEAGLGTSSDAMLCVVPALRKKLAPLDSRRLLSALCRSANSYRQNSEWQRAETILLWACTHFAPSREQSQHEKPSQVFEEALLATAELYRWSISHSIWTPDDPRATSRRLFGTDGIRKIFHAYGHVGAECRTILDCYQNLSDTLGGPTSKYITCESPCNDLKVALYNRERVRALHALCFITPETVRSGDFSLRSALPWAIRNNWSEIAEVLLEMGVDVNSKAVDANSSSKPSSAFAAFLPPGQSDDDARTALSYCAELGYEKYLAPLLHHGAAIDEPAGRLSRAPLSYAAANGHHHFVQLLLESAGFVNVDRQDNQGRSCLALAAQNGHSAVVQVLLDYTVNVDITDNGWTPLMMASSNGHTSVVQQLLDRGAQVDKVDTKWTSKLDIPSNKMDTALILAASKGHLDIVGKLLDNGADIEKKGRYDRTALSNAAESGHVSVTRMLLERGANIESKDDKGRTPLSNAAGSGHSSVARLLLDRGAYVDSRAEYNDTPLMYAITGRHHDMASLLIKGGANVNYQRPKGKQFLFGVLPSTPLRAAISSGDELMAELLIEYGADIECTFGGSERDLTPLAVAIDEEKETIAQVLIKRGANVHWISEDGVTMLKRAVRKNALTVVPLLLEKDVNIEACEPLLCAAEMGHTNIAKMLIEKGADLASRTDTHTSPLLKAAEAGHADMVRLLVSKGAPLEETAGSYKRLTALHYAVDGNHVDCVRVLVECGADLEARSFSGETPLHLAAKKRWLDCMRILVDHGASLEAKDSELRTPLYLCAFISRELMNSDNPLPQWVEPLGSRDCIVFLKDRGATVDTSNDRGRLVAARLENILNPAPDPSGDSKP
jgi:ankyrin repeat protein